MVHLLPMNWTDHEPGEHVQVWAYANVDTVELFLNGQSLGVRHFDHKTTVDGRAYLETTEATDDDKTVTGGPVPGQLHEPERQRRQAAPDLARPLRARRAEGGRPQRTAVRSRATCCAPPARRTPCAHAGPRRDRRRRPLARPCDRRRRRRPAACIVPDADDAISFAVTRRRARRARQRPRGERRELPGHHARRVQRQGAGDRAVRRPRPGPITVTATAPGLRTADHGLAVRRPPRRTAPPPRLRAEGPTTPGPTPRARPPTPATPASPTRSPPPCSTATRPRPGPTPS